MKFLNYPMQISSFFLLKVVILPQTILFSENLPSNSKSAVFNMPFPQLLSFFQDPSQQCPPGQVNFPQPYLFYLFISPRQKPPLGQMTSQRPFYTSLMILGLADCISYPSFQLIDRVDLLFLVYYVEFQYAQKDSHRSQISTLPILFKLYSLILQQRSTKIFSMFHANMKGKDEKVWKSDHQSFISSTILNCWNSRFPELSNFPFFFFDSTIPLIFLLFVNLSEQNSSIFLSCSSSIFNLSFLSLYSCASLSVR